MVKCSIQSLYSKIPLPVNLHFPVSVDTAHMAGLIKRQITKTHCFLFEGLNLKVLTLMDLTRLAVVLATSLADCTNCLLATGFGVLEEARRQALHNAEVCLATIVAAESTW